MQSFQKLTKSIPKLLTSHKTLKPQITTINFFSTKNGDDEWNDAWETAWLPPDLTPDRKSSWESDVNLQLTATLAMDSETKAFVEEMNENWEERRNVTKSRDEKEKKLSEEKGSVYSVESMKRDYRLKKQRIHTGLWVKEIEKQEEAKLADFGAGGGGDDIDKLLDSASEIFDATNDDVDCSKIPSSSEFKNKPDGWETTSKAQDGNIWEMSQREEDILLQEFDRRIAYNKFQIASFIKTHIFSRRRPIDGWKYMIEEIGPNARKGKGSVSRLPSLADAATQPFKEEKSSVGSNLTPFRGR